MTSAAGAADFPRDRLPEVALVGRSNVGKSSLINALVRQPLARISATPGKTRLVNIYRVRRGSMPECYLVDLPGYGYARHARPGEGSATEFNKLTDAYFDRPGQRGALLLVDARHPGLSSDLDAWAWLGSQPCARAVVGTKVDKLTQAERVRHAREMRNVFEMPVVLVSARTGEGLDELWKMIASLPNRTAA
ncbi:MAG TPA: ribosome biogenesis GTP-binding protein YihA/YsxC [Vicinamibacterales bacterium]|nr:ribosome biogenesis GTP-binding protein YihA/YsxC [Vicinamibacterales bacterium]